jgi:hypothetical protein
MPSAFDSLYACTATPNLMQFFGVRVRLRRNGRDSAPFTALYSERTFAIWNDAGGSTEVVLRTWLLPTADCQIGGVALEPRTGDRIVDDVQVVWEIMPPDANSAAVRLEQGDREYACSTQRVSTAPERP